MRIIVVALFSLLLTGCASFAQFATPQTFNQRIAYVDGLAESVGNTCLQLSKNERIPVSTLIRCTAKVEQAGDMVDTARALGEINGGGDQLSAAQRLLLEFEEELRRREGQE